MSAEQLLERIRQNVPQLLRELPVWLLWKSVPGELGEKPKKIPYYVTGKVRTGTTDTLEDRAQLVDFEAAARALPVRERLDGSYAGLGIALGEVPGEEITLSGMDFDDCYVNGELDERVTQVLLAAQSYSEKSPSGTGVKIFGTGALRTVKKDAAGLESYSRGRFFTVTGEALNSAGIADLTDAAPLACKLFQVNGYDTTATNNQQGNSGDYIVKNRNNYLSDEAFRLKKQGWSLEQIEPVMLAINQARCKVPLSALEVHRIVAGKAGIAPDEDEWAPPAVVAYGADFDAAKIPRRRWLLGRRRSVGELTVDVGPPGVNKSTLMLTDAVAIATGRQVLGDKVHETGTVRFLAGEDARRDVEARLAGILARYSIKPAELAGRLQVVYLTEHDAMSYCLAQMVDDLAVLNTRMFEWLREDCILATFIDPILAWHRLLENSNEAMQVLSSSLRALAARTQQHVGFDHHVTKVTMADPEGHVGNLAAVRGGGSLAADARWAFTLARLNPVTVAKYGIAEAERKRYRRFDSLKTSYGADDDDTRLLRVEDVHIANGELVGVLVEADPQLTRSAGAEREATERERWRARLAAELDRMLREQRPRSARVAALRLTARAPDLFLRPDGKPLGEDRIRRKLLLEIGDGLPLPDAPQQRVVWRPSERRGDPAEIDLEQGRLL